MRVIDFKDAKCRHCYKCVRYCMVKAISVQNEQAHILKDHCINCGRCMEICPQNAKTFASDMERVKGYLRQGFRTIISIAPSYLGVLEFDRPGQVVDALLKLGFSEVRETAEGAAMVTNEYKRIIRENQMPNIITTCCPSVNDLVEKYYPECVDLMAPVVSPMVAHGRYIKKLYGDDVKVVFLGPCIAKKQEAIGDERVFGAIDAILTFEELAIWLEEAGINIHDCEEQPMGNPDPQVNRLYPISGGVVQSVIAEEEADTYHKVYVDGLANCMEMLECLKRGELDHCFIEANVCEGGCTKGPASARWNTSYVKAKVKIENEVSHKAARNLPDMSIEELYKKFRDNRLSDAVPTEEEIREILKSTGKYSVEDELNCGACGYATCRDKAIAVYQNKAELSMCMPYALTQAESMSNVVMDVTPNMIFIIDGSLRIRECNKKAQDLLGVGREEAVQRYIFEFIEAGDIEETLRTKEPVIHKKIQLEHGRITAEETIVYIENLDSVLVTFQDITREEKLKEQRYNLKVETVEMAQKVIEKQMMVAQEIAGLLGETTAETKVTLTKLRDSILNEGEE
ncbi:PAS domain-containing protein [Faecalicatena sp. AGMB00832]|uniref:PAS domain-containing protein n=1 Tax=Faecalicatena faecalis TaxID=2726362 RepID=A0ABS6D337_9FIRM|nr:[Fe-Fe] hydrogenase large subunit C-terminal domain-containing protein [Faecalicatena faecalis]MBU3875998.1 PAS domain-containing protein [Faecalicatena faecalis]